ncbi:hypothetical protein F3B81_30860 [Bacteroides ovatus]|nr:hypothetical protein F3B81_30860 [Bacteroides ovatus]
MVFLSYLWSEAKFSDMDKVQKQRGSIVLHKETRDGADYIRIEYANSQAVALLLAQDTGMEMAGNGSAYIASAAFSLPDFYDRYSPHAYIDYSRVYVRHPKPKREYTLPKGYLELLEQKRYSLSTIKAYKIYFSDFMEYHKGQDLDLLTVEDINSYMLHMVIRQKIEKIYRQDYDLWEKVIQKAKESGEIRSNTDVKKTAILFRQMFLGLSYEQAFLNGLNVDELAENFRHIYSLLKA